MDKWRRWRVLLGLGLLAVLGLAAVPASVTADDWRTSVVAGDFDGNSPATTTGTDGSTHVFLGRTTPDAAIQDAMRTRDGWRTRTTPYRGRILAATSDSTGVYVFFLDRTGTFAVGKRTQAGRYVAAVPVRHVNGLVEAVAAMLAANGAWQVFFSYIATQGPDSPGVGSGLVTVSSASPTTVRVLRTGIAAPIAAAWLPGGVVALVFGDETSRRLTFGRGVAGRWAFGPLAPGYPASVDVVGRYGHLYVTWIDGKDVLTRESNGRVWGPVMRIAVLPGNRGAVSIDISLGREYVGWSSLEAVIDAPVRNAVLNISERPLGGRWVTTQVSRAASPELLATTAVAGRPTLVYSVTARLAGEIRASTRASRSPAGSR